MGTLARKRSSTRIYRRYINLPPEPSSAREARHWLEARFTELGHPLGERQEYDAIVIISELATNATIHAKTWFRGHVTQTGDHLMIGVTDYAPTVIPGPRQPDEFEEGGRGMEVVAGLCDKWGVKTRDEEREKDVWVSFKI